MEELNRKLAEWAGFKKVRDATFPDTALGYPEMWHSPIDTYFYVGTNTEALNMPDFTSPLDVCFRWLVPKLENVNGRRLEEIHLYPTSRDNYLCELDMVQIENRYSPECEVKWAAAEAPALALCLAISKLIEQEVDNDAKGE